MNKTSQKIAVTLCALALSALAQAAENEAKLESAQPAQTTTAGKPPAMSDLPFMKAEAKRLAVLMERLQKETDPAERRKIMAETTCAQ